MSRRGHERANGPYPHGKRWRVVFTGATGVSETVSYASYAEAAEEAEAYRRIAGSRSVGEAVRDYLAERRTEGLLRESSEVTARHRLTAILRLVDGDRHLCALTPAVARQLYAQRTKEVAPDTHRGELAIASRWAAWCVQRGWLPSNPFESVQPIGKKAHGKPQLRVDESRRLLATVGADESPEATAVLIALLMGLRAHEIVERVARDLDDGGRLLWIPKSKTDAGKRQLTIPAQLQPRLIALASGKRPDERLFGEMTRHALHYHTVRFADLAGVPRVTPHGLRGTFATLAVTSQLPTGGLSVEQTARAMGHADCGTTMRRHYMAPGAEESAANRRVEELLTPAPKLDDAEYN